MFTNVEKLYIRNRSAAARWNTAKRAVTAYTAVPASASIWEFVQSPNLKLIFAYLVIILAVVVLQMICSGKVAYYESMVSLLKTRLDHPPTKSQNLQSKDKSIKIKKKRDEHGN